MGWMPKNNEPIKLNGAFRTNSTIMRLVVASTAEAKLGALFHSQTGMSFRQILNNLGHPQPKTPIHCDNATAAGITNTRVKRQHSRSMEMRFFGLETKWPRICTNSHGTPKWKILLIIRASIMWDPTTLLLGFTTYRKIL
jgi:hypothetical protein